MEPRSFPALFRSVAFGFLLVLAVYLIFFGINLRTGLGMLPDILMAFVVGLLATGLLATFLSPLSQLPRLLKLPAEFSIPLALGAAVTFFLLMVAFDVPGNVALPFGFGLLLAQGTLGAAIGMMRAKMGARTLIAALVLMGVGLDIGIAYILIHPGTNAGLIQIDHAPSVGATLEDPALPGAYQVRRLFYGSGTDRHRPEFGPHAELITQSIDVTLFVSVSGTKAGLRRAYWGFDLDAAPINGRAWYPDGQGPFPLVLIAHGNDLMTEPADTGYAYLGELLASRGYIFVSVDHNYLNAYLGGPLRNENDARAVVLLEHIRDWQSWNDDPASPFFRKVDLENIALIGHSRGGEAAAIAAYFAGLEHYPDDASVGFGYDFSIRSVVALAPSVGTYRPAGEALILENVNYLLLQGSHDADTSSNWGSIQFQRVEFTDTQDWVKSEIYIHRANHSQFNTAWSRLDSALPAGWLLNTRPLLLPEEQRRAAQVLISAFLEATLRGQKDYLELFSDPRLGAAWLPDTFFVGQFMDASFQLLLDFEEQDAPVDWSATGFQTQSIQELQYRNGGSQQNSALQLAWERPGAALTIPIPTTAKLDIKSILTFNLYDQRPYDPESGLLNFTLQFRTANGTAASVPVADLVTTFPPIAVQFTKWPLLESARYKNPTEPVLQTVSVPLNTSPELDPGEISEIVFLFDQTPDGVILVDEIGLRTE